MKLFNKPFFAFLHGTFQQFLWKPQNAGRIKASLRAAREILSSRHNQKQKANHKNLMIEANY